MKERPSSPEALDGGGDFIEEAPPPARRWRIECGDLRELDLSQFGTFDAVLCDPPYELGFMGKRWDSSGVAFDVALWERIRAVLRPGAPLLAFGGTRTYHRMTCAIEDAGFEIRDCLTWLYGQGFPKSLDVSKAIDKRRDDTAEIRRVCRFLRVAMLAASTSSSEVAKAFGVHSRMVDHWAARDTDSQPTLPTWDQWLRLKEILSLSGAMDEEVRRLNGRKGEDGEAWKAAAVVGEHEGEPPGLVGERFRTSGSAIKAPSLPSARLWDGYGTALKPAWEPCVLARVPLDGTVAANVQAHGCGALAIDASRLAGGKDVPSSAPKDRPSQLAKGAERGRSDDTSGFDPNVGRWPANVLLDEVAAAQLDEQSGERPSTLTGRASPIGQHAHPSIVQHCESMFGVGGAQANVYADSGGASRFFFTSKVSTSERNDGLDDLPTLTGGEATDRVDDSAGTKSPRAGSGRTGGAKNPHPTMKPVALTEYLARLVLPPRGIGRPRRILVPFAGVGSEVLGALRAGWDEIVGIELDPHYAAIARLRLSRVDTAHQERLFG